ncbi:zinc ribbon domain-containing protein [Actinoplanes sp. NPDC023936]|uniref:zinc ribbon domain-containing protein n=1 Tax=Actinoplanes sp. NPDC023936 TaxID=3154910 RepID=UPI0033E53BF1
MFLLFGISSKDHMVGTHLMTCEICGWQAPQQLLKRTTRFTLFFIPLFPVKAAQYFLVCGHCQGFRRTDPSRLGVVAR